MKQMITVLSTFKEGLDAIQHTLFEGIEQMAANTPIVITEQAMPVTAPAPQFHRHPSTPTPKTSAPAPAHSTPPSTSGSAVPLSAPKSKGTVARKIVCIDDTDS